MSTVFNTHRIKTVNVHESCNREGKNTVISGRVTPTQRDALERIAAEQGMSMSEVTEQAVTLFLMFYPHHTQLGKYRDQLIAKLNRH